MIAMCTGFPNCQHFLKNVTYFVQKGGMKSWTLVCVIPDSCQLQTYLLFCYVFTNIIFTKISFDVCDKHQERINQKLGTEGEGGSLTVEVLGDVLPARVCLFGLLGYTFWQYQSILVWARVCFLGNFSQRNAPFLVIPVQKPTFLFWSEKIWQVLSRKSQLMALLM